MRTHNIFSFIPILCSPLMQFEIMHMTVAGVPLFYVQVFLLWTFLYYSGYSIFTSYSYTCSSLLGPQSFIMSSIFNMILNPAAPYTGLFLSVFFSEGLFLIFANMVGTLPWALTLSSHIIITLTLSVAVFLWLNAVLVASLAEAALNLFLPTNTPLGIIMLLIPIEILSYWSRVLSLSIRLFANLLAGHTLMHILINFFYGELIPNPISLWPFFILCLILIMEFGVAALQVYVYITLLSLYASDTNSVNTH